MYSSTDELLEAAANRGNLRAAMRLASRLRNKNINAARRYYQLVFDNGQTAGATGLAELLESDINRTHDDLIAALGYRYLVIAVDLALLDGLQGEVYERQRNQLLSDMRQYESQVPASVIEAGHEQAKELLRGRSEPFRIYY